MFLLITTPLTDLQDRQRAPQKQLSRCLENRTRIESPMSGISDEEVDYGSFASIANPAIIPIRIVHGVHSEF